MLPSKLLLSLALALLLSLGVALEANMSNRSVNSVDFSPFLRNDSLVPAALKRALKTVEHEEDFPSCTRMAASGIMYSCASMGSKNLAIDDSKILFAARLAICERHESKAPVLRECKRFVPTVQNVEKKSFLGYFRDNGLAKPVVGFPIYEENTQRDLNACLEGIRSSDQTWSSYTNGLQTASVFCHAVRGDIERDELLNLYKMMTEITVANVESFQHMDEMAQETREAFHQLVLNIRTFAMNVFRDNREVQEKIQQLWDHEIEIMRTGMQDAVNQIKTQLQEVNLKINNTGEIAVQAVADASTKIDALVTKQKSELAGMSSQAEAAREVTDYISEALEQVVVKAVYALTKDLATSHAIANNISISVQDISLASTESVEQAVAVQLQMLQLSQDLQQIKGEVGEISDSVNRSKHHASQLVDSLEVLAPIVSGVTASFKSFKASAWYILVAGIAFAGLALIKLCPGGPILLHLSVRLVKQTYNHAVGKFVLGLLVVCAIVAVLRKVASLPQIYNSWTFNELSSFQQAGVVFVVTFVACVMLGVAWHRFRLNDREGALDDDELPRLEDKRPCSKVQKERRVRKWDV